MHELSLCHAIIGIINEHIAERHCVRVLKVVLEIGQLAAVDPSALRFGFEAATKGTIIEQAILEIIEIEGEALCEPCQKTVKLDQYYDPCPLCGNFSLTITQGEALRVQSMEVE